MTLQDLVDKLAADFKADPRNKISVNEEMLIASATEETGGGQSAPHKFVRSLRHI